MRRHGHQHPKGATQGLVYESTNPNCFVWCRLGVSKPTYLSVSRTEVVPSLHISMAILLPTGVGFPTWNSKLEAPRPHHRAEHSAKRVRSRMDGANRQKGPPPSCRTYSIDGT